MCVVAMLTPHDRVVVLTGCPISVPATVAARSAGRFSSCFWLGLDHEIYFAAVTYHKLTGRQTGHPYHRRSHRDPEASTSGNRAATRSRLTSKALQSMAG